LPLESLNDRPATVSTVLTRAPMTGCAIGALSWPEPPEGGSSTTLTTHMTARRVTVVKGRKEVYTRRFCATVCRRVSEAVPGFTDKDLRKLPTRASRST